MLFSQHVFGTTHYLTTRPEISTELLQELALLPYFLFNNTWFLISCFENICTRIHTQYPYIIHTHTHTSTIDQMSSTHLFLPVYMGTLDTWYNLKKKITNHRISTEKNFLQCLTVVCNISVEFFISIPLFQSVMIL